MPPRSGDRSPLLAGGRRELGQRDATEKSESLQTTRGVPSPRGGGRKASEARKDREKPPRAPPTANGGRDEKARDARNARRPTAPPPTAGRRTRTQPSEYADGIKGSPAPRGGATAAAPCARPHFAGIGEGERRAGSAERARQTRDECDIRPPHAAPWSR